jgi:hypothetical protein
MAAMITITRPDIVSLIEEAAEKLTAGDKIEVVALALRRLLEKEARVGSLFAAHPGSARVREGVDLTAPVFSGVLDAESGKELER